MGGAIYPPSIPLWGTLINDDSTPRKSNCKSRFSYFSVIIYLQLNMA